MRQAFPKAKTPPPPKTTYGQRPRPQSKGRGRQSPSQYAPRPPRIKKAAILGVIMGAAYFLVIQYLWKTGNTTVLGNLLIALVACVIFMGIVYLTDRIKYQRYLRKKNAPPK